MFQTKGNPAKDKKQRYLLFSIFHRFPDRFFQRVRRNSNAIFHVMLWAFAAEALNHTWIPRLVNAFPQRPLALAGMSSPQGVLVNCLGAFLAGAAGAVLDANYTASEKEIELNSSVEDSVEAGGKGAYAAKTGHQFAAFRAVGHNKGYRGSQHHALSAPTIAFLAAEFNIGFVPCLTSFSGLAEQLSKARGTAALFCTCFCGFVGGPMLFLAGSWASRRLGIEDILHRQASKDKHAADEAESQRTSCRTVKVFLLAVVLLTFLLETLDSVSGSAADLASGMAFAALAVLINDWVTMLLEGVFASHGHLMHGNLFTITANCLGCATRIVASPSVGGDLLWLGPTFRTSFCGMLTAYGNFCRDAASWWTFKLDKQSVEGSFVWNVLLAMITAVILKGL